MAVSPDAWPRRAAHAEDVFPPPATARPEQDEPEQDQREQGDAGRVGPEQDEPDPPEDGWEPV